MFFTLSGFRISDIIRGEWARSGRLSYSRFYRNRAFRLLPALVVLLAVYGVVEVVTQRAQDPSVDRSVVVGLLYLADLPKLEPGPGLLHLWSLAVEEQFYLFWPVLLVLALRTRRVALLFIAMTIAPLLVTVAALGLVHETAGCTSCRRRGQPLSSSEQPPLGTVGASRPW